MTIYEWLQDSMVRLRDAGVDSPRRDCLVLVEDLLGKDRAWILSHHEMKLTAKQIAVLNQHLQRRINREPLAYIRGKAWFYGRFFEVNSHVMVPRPESESFITLLKNIYINELAARPHRFDAMQGGGEARTEPYIQYDDGALEPPTQQSTKSGGRVSGSARKQAGAAMRIVDVGTGSGCLAITAKLELPEAEVLAVDIDQNALKIAKINSTQHKADIKFIRGSLLEPINGTPMAIIANLPYVPKGMVTSPEITKEPSLALFSGTDGLDHYRKLWEQIGELSKKPKYILTESLKSQHKGIQKLAQVSGYSLLKTDCLVQLFSAG